MRQIISRIRIAVRNWWFEKIGLYRARKRNERLARIITIANTLTNGTKKSPGDRRTRYVFEHGRGYKIFTSEDFDQMKKRHILKSGVTIYDIYKKSVYVATYKKEVKDQWRKARMAEKKRIEDNYPIKAI